MIDLIYRPITIIRSKVWHASRTSSRTRQLLMRPNVISDVGRQIGDVTDEADMVNILIN